MKRVLFIALLLAFGAGINVLSAQKKETKVVCFKSNMDCLNCEKTLTEHLKFEKGVKDLKVDHVSNTIMVEYKKDKNTDEGFVKAIEKKGYKADKISLEQYGEIKKKATSEEHLHGTEVKKDK